MRGRVVKSVGRPADIYSLGAVFYYLISGAYANPKNLFDAFRKFVEYERKDESNTIAAYVDHEYRTIQNIRAPKAEGQGAPELAPEDRFFSYKHYLDGNGELIDPAIMMIIAKETRSRRSWMNSLRSIAPVRRQKPRVARPRNALIGNCPAPSP